MACEAAISLVCEATGWDQSQLGPGDDVESVEPWDSLSHVSIILKLETALGRPLTTEEIIEITSIAQIQSLLDTSDGS